MKALWFVIMLMLPAILYANTGIRGGGFLVEEAWTNDPLTVRHSLSMARGWDRPGTATESEPIYEYAQERPFFTRSLHFVFNVSAIGTWASSHGPDLGDMGAGFRYIVASGSDRSFAISPELFVALRQDPEAEMLYDRAVKTQLLIPFSMDFASRWSAHALVGATYLQQRSSRVEVDCYGHGENYDVARYFQNTGISLKYDLRRNVQLGFDFASEIEWRDRSLMSNIRPNTRFEVGGDAKTICPNVRYAFNFSNGRQWVIGAGMPVRLISGGNQYGLLVSTSFEYPIAAESVMPVERRR
jgi:hypothetical protein